MIPEIEHSEALVDLCFLAVQFSHQFPVVLEQQDEIMLEMYSGGHLWNHRYTI